MTNFSEAVRLPTGDEAIAPVTILDAQGRVVRVVSAAEFRRARSAATIANLDDQRPVVLMGAKPGATSHAGDSRLVSDAARASRRASAS